MCVKRAIPPEQKRQQLALLVTKPSSLVPGCPLTFFSKTVCNLKDNFLEVCFVNQHKQSPLRSKLHTNVPSTLLCVFSWLKYYAHPHHSLKQGNDRGSHKHTGL